MTSTSTDRRQGVNAGAAFKVPVRAATTANITLSGAQTIDGVACVTDDRVLVKNQTTGADNGIYVVDTGAWSRAVDFDGTYDARNGTLVEVNSGTVSARLVYVLTTSDPITIGTTSLSFAVMSPSSPISLPLSLAQGGTSGTSAVTGLAGLGVVACTAVGGTANAITCTVDSTVTAYRTNQIFELTPASTNTGATTFTPTPSGAGALAGKNIFAGGAALVGGELVSGVPVLLHYDGTQLNLLGGLSARSETFGIACSVSANALTIALTTEDGSALSSTNPARIRFRSATAATGAPVTRVVTTAATLVLSNGSTLGTTASIANRFWIVAFDDAGTVRLGAINCLSAKSIYPLRDDVLASSTAEGGAGAADSAQVFYTGTAVASKAVRVLGYIEYSSGLGTSGVYASAPTKTQVFGPGVSLPGQLIQTARKETAVQASGTSHIPNDDTIPQITEGDQYIASDNFSPTSAANVLDVEVQAWMCHNQALNALTGAIFRDATANAVAAGQWYDGTATAIPQLFRLHHRELASSTAATAYKYRWGDSNNGAGTSSINGDPAAGRRLGGVMISWLEIMELMA